MDVFSLRFQILCWGYFYTRLFFAGIKVNGASKRDERNVNDDFAKFSVIFHSDWKEKRETQLKMHFDKFVILFKKKFLMNSDAGLQYVNIYIL